MNKKGFLDFDMDIEMLLPVGLALIGAFVAYFTATGGFSVYVTGESFDPGFLIKIASAVGGAVIGFVWGYYMVNN